MHYVQKIFQTEEKIDLEGKANTTGMLEAIVVCTIYCKHTQILSVWTSNGIYQKAKIFSVTGSRKELALTKQKHSFESSISAAVTVYGNVNK